MTPITVAQLIDAGIWPTQAKLFAEPLNMTFDRFELNTPARRALFIGECSHESAGFAQLEELLSYRDAGRIVRVFRRAFDLDLDGAISSTELDFAATFVREPVKLANHVYAGRNGNGDEASGDGWRFRARGPLGLTGRANYAAAEADLRMGLLNDPDLVASPLGGCMAAGWFWQANRINTFADAGDTNGATRVINGRAMLGAVERVAMVDRALQALA